MKKRAFLIALLLLPCMVYGQNNNFDLTQNEQLVKELSKLSPEQLFSMASYHLNQNNRDTTLILLSLFINTPVKESDIMQQKRICSALNVIGTIYYYMSDFRSAYDYHIRALNIAEKYNFEDTKVMIYNHIGNIFYAFNKNDIAKTNYLKALDICNDSVYKASIFNNIGCIELYNGNIDSAFYYLDNARKINKLTSEAENSVILSSIAETYQKTKQYDSALYYYRLTLKVSKQEYKSHNETQFLSKLSQLFFEINQPDSALYYIDLSNSIAASINFLDIIAENNLIVSKIYESKGNTEKAFEYYKKYSELKDSVYSNKTFGEITQLQRLYEVSKTNRQIEQLIIEKQVVERTNYLQRKILYIVTGFLIIVVITLIIINSIRLKLKKTYKILFNKNKELLKLEAKQLEKNPETYCESNTVASRNIISEDSFENGSDENVENNSEQISGEKSEIITKKYQNIYLSEEQKNILINKINYVMDNDPAVYQPEFTLLKLSKLAKSNYSHVSYIINEVYKENFNSYLNRYRTKEAQRLFMTLSSKNITVTKIANKVGYKSRSAFYNAFKENTGLTPNYFFQIVKSEKQGND